MESRPTEIAQQEVRRPNPNELLTIPPIKETSFYFGKSADILDIAVELAEEEPTEFGAYDILKDKKYRVGQDDGPDEKYWTLGEISEILTERPEELYTIVDAAVYLTNYVVQNKVDTIFFLDKSARSTAFAFRKVWQLAYPDTPYPNIRFVNIPKQLSTQDPEKHRWEDSFVRNERVIDEAVTAVKGTFHFHQPEMPLGKVVIADEWLETGSSARAAKEVVAKAFGIPEEDILCTGLHADELELHRYPELAGVKENGDREWDEPIRHIKAMDNQVVPSYWSDLSDASLDIQDSYSSIQTYDRNNWFEDTYGQSKKNAGFKSDEEYVRESMVSQRVTDEEYRRQFLANRRAISLAIVALFGKHGEKIQFVNRSGQKFSVRDQDFYYDIRDRQADDYDTDDYDDL